MAEDQVDQPDMAEGDANENTVAVSAKVDLATSDVSTMMTNLMAAMGALIGGLATQPVVPTQPVTVDDLPEWLERAAATTRDMVAKLPKPQPAPLPEEASEDQWKFAISKQTGKVLGILPENALAERWFSTEADEEIVSKNALSSYDSAVARCKKAVQTIIKECQRTNRKFRDTDFELEWHNMCLRSLVPDPDGDPFSPAPQGYAQARKIFNKPQFYVNGATAGDIRQGFGGDCWFLAGVAALTNFKAGLSQNYVQVDGDEKVGAYGFVFHRGKYIFSFFSFLFGNREY
jgi:hypothetical protein